MADSGAEEAPGAAPAADAPNYGKLKAQRAAALHHIRNEGQQYFDSADFQMGGGPGAHAAPVTDATPERVPHPAASRAVPEAVPEEAAAAAPEPAAAAEEEPDYGSLMGGGHKATAARLLRHGGRKHYDSADGAMRAQREEPDTHCPPGVAAGDIADLAAAHELHDAEAAAAAGGGGAAAVARRAVAEPSGLQRFDSATYEMDREGDDAAGVASAPAGGAAAPEGAGHALAAQRLLQQPGRLHRFDSATHQMEQVALQRQGQGQQSVPEDDVVGDLPAPPPGAGEAADVLVRRQLRGGVRPRFDSADHFSAAAQAAQQFQAPEDRAAAPPAAPVNKHLQI